MKTPDEIMTALLAKWTGTDDELEELVEAVVEDVVGSFTLAGATPEQVTTVRDYAANHYFA